MSVDPMRRRPNIPQEWPTTPWETEASWSNRLVAKGAEYGVYRQCSIGWHAECSQRQIVGESCPCRCYCHVLQAKRFTDTELAAEVWHSVANYFTLGPGPEAVTEASRNMVIERFATLPHYDQEPTP